jgi:CRISPR/Cas system-associated exonuclease Cas4 (RecB family)
MQKLQKSKTKIPSRPHKRPILRKLTKPIERDLVKSTNLASPTSPTSGQSEKQVTLETLDTSLDIDLDPSQIDRLTSDMKAQILSSLSTFKSASQLYISKSIELETEVDNFQEKFSDVQLEINDLLIESNKSKLELSRMRNFIESPKNRPQKTLDIDLSSVKMGKDEALQETLKHLKSEVFHIKEKIGVKETEVSLKESENVELKNLIEKMRENLESLERTKKPASCSGCLIF